TAATWSQGSICHVGRLERRKGVLELAEAFAEVAANDRRLTLEFAGSDTPIGTSGETTVGGAIRARVPRPLHRQIRFHGALNPEDVGRTLSRAWVAAVPSRWENFPYSCIESMASGLPVIASPRGGMKELVVDGVSGWIADEPTPAGLGGALRRALATSPEVRARMGEAAEATVRRECDNDRVVTAHLDFKRELTSRQANHVVTASVSGAPQSRMGAIVRDSGHNLRLDDCLSSMRDQTEPPELIRVLAHDGVQASAEDSITHIVASIDPSLLAVALVDSDARLHSEFFATCRRVFTQRQRIGLLSAWTSETGVPLQVRIQANPERPHVSNNGRIAPFVVLRMTAVQGVLRENFRRVSSSLELCDEILRAGWTAMTYPDVMGSVATGSLGRPGTGSYSPIARAVQRLHTPVLQWLLTSPSRETRMLVRHALRTPGQSLRRLLEWFVRE
ncbi:MAG: glycosyltransferase family 4 protein, partial [Vicinamibacterales bacterium]